MRGLRSMRRRGLEPPPGYPGPGPQPGARKCRSVQIVQERPERLVPCTIWTHQTIWMLPRMLPRGRDRRIVNAALIPHSRCAIALNASTMVLGSTQAASRRYGDMGDIRVGIVEEDEIVRYGL